MRKALLPTGLLRVFNSVGFLEHAQALPDIRQSFFCCPNPDTRNLLKGGVKLADMKKGAVQVALSDQEKRVVDILREIKYGEVKVVIQDGVPVRVDEIRKSIKI